MARRLALVVAGGFEVAMTAREYRRTALAQQTGDLIGLLVRQGKVLFVSPSYERLLGYKPAKLVGRIGLDLIHPEDRARVAAALTERIQDAETSREHEVRFLHAGGSYRWLMLSGVNKLHDPLIGGIVVSSRDITAGKQTEAALEFHASHDALTTLPNRFMLQESIEHALEAGSAAASPVALLLIDLNHFKGVNDALGHATGDDLLLEVGRRLALEVTADDFMARAGGDEFAILSRNGGKRVGGEDFADV